MTKKGYIVWLYSVLILSLVSFPVLASETILFTEDFEDVNIGQVPDGFIVMGGTPGVSDEVSEGAGGKSLKINPPPELKTWGDYAVLGFKAQQKVTIEFSVYMTNTATKALSFMCYQNEKSIEKPENAGPYVAVDNPNKTQYGNFMYYDGAYKFFGTAEPNRWYRIKVVINPDIGSAFKGTYDIYIDDMDTPVVSKANFRNPLAQVAYIGFSLYQWDKPAGPYYIDNIKVWY